MKPITNKVDYLIIQRGFTLIELLVVVLIIGILTSVAVPQYQKAVERSKAAEAITLLASIAQAYQVYYLANGTFATKFAELDVDIPFKGNTKAVNVHNNTGDTKSNDDWSFQIEKSDEYVTLFATRIDGKYKGAGVMVSFENPNFDANKQVKCFERKSASYIIFDTGLPKGAYCERVMQARQDSENQYSRKYILP